MYSESEFCFSQQRNPRADVTQMWLARRAFVAASLCNWFLCLFRLSHRCCGTEQRLRYDMLTQCLNVPFSSFTFYFPPSLFKQWGSGVNSSLWLFVGIKRSYKTIMQESNIWFRGGYRKISCWCVIRMWLAGFFNCPRASALKCGREMWRCCCGPVIYGTLDDCHR